MSRLKMKIGSRMRFVAAVAMFITVDSPAFPSPLSIPARTLLRIRKGQRTYSGNRYSLQRSLISVPPIRSIKGVHAQQEDGDQKCDYDGGQSEDLGSAFVGPLPVPGAYRVRYRHVHTEPDPGACGWEEEVQRGHQRHGGYGFYPEAGAPDIVHKVVQLHHYQDHEYRHDHAVYRLLRLPEKYVHAVLGR